ncbi:MAG TPA: hypothetical protein VNM91_12600 [Dehalococcoidia bacterium]|nr:hypothetical protein [Dehalococcoidia bacterium]
MVATQTDPRLPPSPDAGLLIVSRARPPGTLTTSAASARARAIPCADSPMPGEYARPPI